MKQRGEDTRARGAERVAHGDSASIYIHFREIPLHFPVDVNRLGGKGFIRGAYHWGHEPCWYAVRKGKPAHWRGDRTQSTVWEVDNLLTANRGSTEDDPENSITGHGTQKPVELVRRPIVNHTETGDAVYDCFLGSGSCLIAAQTTGRICYGIDIDPKYVDCAVIRWQNLTGGKATLEGDGRTFDQIAEERQQQVTV